MRKTLAYLTLAGAMALSALGCGPAPKQRSPVDGFRDTYKSASNALVQYTNTAIDVNTKETIKNVSDGLIAMGEKDKKAYADEMENNSEYFFDKTNELEDSLNEVNQLTANVQAATKTLTEGMADLGEFKFSDTNYDTSDNDTQTSNPGMFSVYMDNRSNNRDVKDVTGYGLRFDIPGVNTNWDAFINLGTDSYHNETKTLDGSSEITSDAYNLGVGANYRVIDGPSFNLDLYGGIGARRENNNVSLKVNALSKEINETVSTWYLNGGASASLNLAKNVELGVSVDKMFYQEKDLNGDKATGTNIGAFVRFLYGGNNK